MACTYLGDRLTLVLPDEVTDDEADLRTVADLGRRVPREDRCVGEEPAGRCINRAFCLVNA